MATRKFGVILEAKDHASKTVRKFADGVGASAGVVRKLGSIGVAAFREISTGIVVANSAMQIAKAGFGVISDAVGSTFEAMRDLRGETNPLIREMNRLATQSKAAKAALGTAFASAVLGIATAFEGAISGSADFLDNNRKLIATRIVQFLFKAAKALVSGIAAAANLANTAWYTLTTTVDESIIVFTEWVGAWTESMLMMTDNEEDIALYNARLSKMANMHYDATLRIAESANAHADYADQITALEAKLLKLTNEGYKPAMKAAETFADAAGGTPLESAEAALIRLRTAAFDLLPALDKGTKLLGKGLIREEGMLQFEKFEQRIDRVNRMLGVASPKSIGVIKQALEGIYADLGVPLDVDVDMENLELATEAMRVFADTAEVSLLDAKEGFNLLADSVEQSSRGMQTVMDVALTIPSVMSSFGTLVHDIFQEINEGTITTAEGFKVLAKSAMASILAMVRTGIMAYAALSAAATFAADSSIPFGTLAAAGLAALAFSIAEAWLNKVPEPESFAKGGLVTGGVQGRDSVPAMLTPGEFILTKEQTDNMRSGAVGAGSSTINIELNSTMPQSRAEIKRYVRQNVVPALRELKAQGMF